MNGTGSEHPGLAAVLNYRFLPPGYGTAGQPRPDQFAAVAQAGYRLVVNLACSDSPGAVANEAEIWHALGVPYVHLPVAFTAPQTLDFTRFCASLAAHGDDPVFVHCAYNWRASAFVMLHRVQIRGVDRARAQADLESVWQPDAVWTAFIEALTRHCA